MAAPHRDFWLVLSIALLLNAAGFDPNINLYDEGIILAGAESVHAGKLPYKDFWTMYGPGQFYLASWLFSLFGFSTLPVRGIGLLAKALIVALGFVAARGISGRVPAALAATTIACLLIGMNQDGFPIFPATALALGAVLSLARARGGRQRHFMIAGVLTALTACFRHDLGAYTAIAAVVALGVDSWLHGVGAGRARATLREIGLYGLGIFALALPVAAYFLATVPLADLYENLIHIPSSIYPQTRSLPWPGAEVLEVMRARPQAAQRWAVYVPFVVGAIALAGVAMRAKRREAEADAEPRFLVLLLALTSLLFTLKGVIRVSNLHMAPALVLATVLLPAVLAGALRQGWRGRVVAAVVLAPAIVIVALASWPGVGAVQRGMERLRGGDAALATLCRHPELPRMRCVQADPDYIAAARFVAAHSGPADTIYVGVGRHDKLFVNAVAFYFLAERRPATKWYELHPGVQTQLRIQREMVDAMTASPPRLVVLDSRWDDAREPNRSRDSSGAKVLDEFLSERYADVARFGPVRVLAPR